MGTPLPEVVTSNPALAVTVHRYKVKLATLRSDVVPKTAYEPSTCSPGLIGVQHGIKFTIL